MKMGKILALILVFILILPSISLNVLSQPEDQNNDSETFIHKLLKKRFDMGFKGGRRYYFQQFRPPTVIQAYPSSVSLKYLNVTTFQIGQKNDNNTDWQPMIFVAGTWNWGWFSPNTIFNFEFVPPENTSMDVWNVQFNPKSLILATNRENLNWPGAEIPFMTNVTIMLKPSVDPSIVTQDVILKVNIVKTETIDKLGILKVPKFFKTHKEEYIQKCEELGIDPWFANSGNVFMYNLFLRFLLFRGNLKFPYVDTTIDSTVEILIKVDKYHLAEIIPTIPLKIEPYEVKSIPIKIRNIGSHMDTYNFRVNCDDKNMIVTPPPALTLNPGEEGQALIGVAAPKIFMSVGSTTSIFVEAYSIDDPETVFSNTVILTTSGIYATGGATYNIIFILIILFIIIVIFIYFLKKHREKICEKPDKPWEIPKEKEYLEKLKKENKKEYEQVIQMMKEEYESSLLWYNNYVRATIEQQRKEKQEAIQKEKEMIEQQRKEKQKAIQKEKKSKAKKEKEKKPIVPEEKKIPVKTEKVEKKPEEKPKRIDTEAIESERQKQKIILKIKREQEKQSKKFGF